MSVVAQRFGANLASAREGSGVTQEELSFRAGLHRTEIGLLERGGRIPRIDTLAKLAGALGVPTSSLLDASTGSRANSRAAASACRMRPRNEANNKKRPRQRKLKTTSRQERASQKPKAKRSKKKGPKKQAKEELNSNPPKSRHSTNPFDSCLGRSLVIPNVRKALA